LGEGGFAVSGFELWDCDGELRAVRYHGSALDVLAERADEFVDAVVTDPPYELGFMGRAWDASGIAYNVELWKQCFRVLKPGGHLLAFGGTRTSHRLTCAIEDAGFEIRDEIAWLYGSGFPKSLDVSKAIDKAAGAERPVVGLNPRAAQQTAKGDATSLGRFAGTSPDLTAPVTDNAKRWAGWGTALKPAHEPIVVARKPLVGTVAANVLAHGTGALNIDACRVEAQGRPLRESSNRESVATYGDGLNGSRAVGVTDAGRWPTNVVLDEEVAAELDEQSGISASTRSVRKMAGSVLGNGETLQSYRVPEANIGGYDDTGGASRFFPVFRYQAKAPTRERPKVDGVAHPTVKPLELMRWLVRLVAAPDGIVLDPFAGSGTTLEAAALEGMRCIGIEQSADYLPLIAERLRRAGLVPR
jgi:site-specific DNA-methyltransferase (adenine-specific)